MQPTEFIDKNFILVLLFTLGLILTTLIYLGTLHYMLRSKLWFIPLIIIIGLFGYTMFEMNTDFQQESMGTVNHLIMLVALKTTVMLHGIYYLSVLLGKYIGIKKATISLKENEVFIVLISLALVLIMNNVHTFSWSFDRGVLINLINLFMVYVLVNVVFYLGEIKYFFVFAVPVFLTFLYNGHVLVGFAEQKSIAYHEMQLALIGWLLLSAVYMGIKIRLEFMDDREIARKIEDVKIEVPKTKDIETKDIEIKDIELKDIETKDLIIDRV